MLCANFFFNRLQRIPACLAIVLAIFLFFLLPFANAQNSAVKIGVLSEQEEEFVLEHWIPTADYLNEKIPGYDFQIIPIPFKDFIPIIKNEEVDFFICNPIISAELNANYGTSTIAFLEEPMFFGTKATVSGEAISNIESPAGKEKVFPNAAFYSEWSFGKVKHVTQQMSDRVAIELLSMPPNSQAAKSAEAAGWSVPMGYQTVKGFLRELGIGPYREFGKITLTKILKLYRLLIIVTFLLILILTIGIGIALFLNNKIQRAKNYIELLFKVTPSAIFTVDKDRRITRWNEKAQEITGYTAAEAIGKECSFFMITPCKEKCNLCLGKPYLPVDSEECVIKTKNWQERIILKNVEVLKDILGNAAGGIESFEDITERKNIELMKEEFVNIASHELRTPLTIIKESISLISEGVVGEVTSKQKEFLKISQDNINRLVRIINDLLDVSKIEAGKIGLKKTAVDLHELIRHISSMFMPQIQKKGLDLRLDIAPHKIMVYADSDRVSQVFTNLIGNALKFTDKGYIQIVVNELEKEIECVVIDTGSGIEPEDLPKIFDKFEQFGKGRLADEGPEVKGTGLGLSIVKELIKMHKGKIWAESELGKGSKILFTLPRYSGEIVFKDYTENAIKEAAKSGAKLTIAAARVSGTEGMVNDAKDAILVNIRKIVRENLYREGDFVVREADEILIAIAGCDKRYALVVTDRIKKRIEDYLASSNLSKRLNVRFGVATYPDDAQNEEDIIRVVRSYL